MAPLSASEARDFFAACDYAREYTGSFGFLQDMRKRVERGDALSPNMVAAILRCKARDEAKALPQVSGTEERGIDLRALPEGTIYVAVGEPLQFFKIDHVADGKWAGWVFVKRQAGDNFDRVGSQRPGSTYRGAYAALLEQVVEDTPAAMQAYGQEIGRCGNCNRTLTDAESRVRGIGPDCWEQIQGTEFWMKASDKAAQAAILAEQEQFNEQWAADKAEHARREAAQERAAFMADADTWR